MYGEGCDRRRCYQQQSSVFDVLEGFVGFDQGAGECIGEGSDGGVERDSCCELVQYV